MTTWVRIQRLQCRLRGCAGDNQWKLLTLILGLYLVSVWVVLSQGARPIVDEWIYIDAAQQFATSGRLDISPLSNVPAIFEAVYGGAILWLPGGSQASLGLGSAALSALAAIALWDLLKRSGIRSSSSLLVVSAFLFAGVFYGLSATFMTDAHAVSMTVIAAALFSRGIDGESNNRYWLVAGSMAAAASYLSRPGSIGVVAGVVALAASRRQWSILPWAIALPGTTVAIHLVGQAAGLLRSIRPDTLERLAMPSPLVWREIAIVTSVSIGVWLFPLFPTIVKSNIRSKDWRLALGVIATTGVLLMAVFISGGMPDIGNWLEPSGLFPISSSVAGERSWLVGSTQYRTVASLSCLVTVSAMGTIVRNRGILQIRSSEIGLWSAAGLSLLLVVPTQVANWGMILDRYLIVLLPAVLLSVAARSLTSESTYAQPLSWGLAGLVAIVGFALAIDGMRLQNTVFDTAETTVSAGIGATEIDGGAAWTGLAFGLTMEPEDTVKVPEEYWWRGRFAPGVEPRYVVTLSPLEGGCVRMLSPVQTLVGPPVKVALIDTQC